MQRKNYRIGVVIIVAAALAVAAFFAGHRSSDPPVSSRTQAASHEPAIAAGGLPEVVITAQRIKPDTVALANRDADANASNPPPRSHQR